MFVKDIDQKHLPVIAGSALFFFRVYEWIIRSLLICRKMKLDLDREKGLELFGKLIRTKNIESLQGDQPKTGPEPLHPADSKQKLQVNNNDNNIIVIISMTVI